MKTKKKKAFTLTELLVVVVVIGVLSAVVLPKFSKVIETRRTTEAEELMGAIRTEQEKRCALDKPYVMDFNKLTDLVKADHTKNYRLELASTGISAQRKDNYNYTLQMPSYADGRICCSGGDCEKLNKNYLLCDDLKRTSDYQESPASCAGETLPVEPTACEKEPTACEKEPTSCECNPNQAKCCPDGTVWDGSKCAEKKECPGEKPSDDGQKIQCGGNTCGFQIVSYYCDSSTNYEWKKRVTGTCTPEPPAEEPCPAGAVGINRTDEWACLDGEWVGMAGNNTCTCDPAKKPEPQRETCNRCGEKTREARCDHNSYTWVFDREFGNCSVASEDDCDLCALDPSPANCCSEDEQRLVDGSAQTALPLMIFDAQARRCVCPAGTSRRDNEYGFPECFCDNVAANKALCCPGEPQKEGICYKFAGKWVLQSKKNEGVQTAGWGMSTCNIPHDGSATWNPNDWECSEDEVGTTCEVVDDHHCDWSNEWSGTCGDTIKSVWKCSKVYVHNGW